MFKSTKWTSSSRSCEGKESGMTGLVTGVVSGTVEGPMKYPWPWPYVWLGCLSRGDMRGTVELESRDGVEEMSFGRKDESPLWCIRGVGWRWGWWVLSTWSLRRVPSLDSLVLWLEKKDLKSLLCSRIKEGPLLSRRRCCFLFCSFIIITTKVYIFLSWIVMCNYCILISKMNSNIKLFLGDLSPRRVVVSNWWVLTRRSK